MAHEHPPLAGRASYEFPKPKHDLNLKFTYASRINFYWMFKKYMSLDYEKGGNGFLESLTSDNTDYEMSAINFLPFIHAIPSRYSTLYTAIHQFMLEARRLQVKTCVLTYDQALYVKARDILGMMTPPPDITIIIRLGGFHTLLSFFGVIGFIMKDSGLEQVLSTIYGENTVKHMLVGHQYARALRAHTLILLALIRIIYSKIEQNDNSFKDNILFAGQESVAAPQNVEELLQDDIFQEVTDSIQKYFEKLAAQNPTCKLWVQYYQMVFLFKDFMHAEKSGASGLHLQTVERMIPFFLATGHFNYARSTQVYLDDMKNLKETMDEKEYILFTDKGYWTSRRSDRYFSGIFTDHTIEQTLMRLIKMVGGIFQRGVTESVAYQWIKGYIYTKDVIAGLEQFTKCSFDRNYQHKDSTDSRMKHDKKAVNLTKDFFKQYDPFPDSIDELINIANGMSGSEASNCHLAFEVGIEIMNKIAGTSTPNYN